jgi:hypothetical protein
VADRGPDPRGERVTGVLMEPARLGRLDAVTDSEFLERRTHARDSRPVVVLKADIVRRTDLPVAEVFNRRDPSHASPRDRASRHGRRSVTKS